MSIALTSQPNPLSFVRNHPAYNFAVSGTTSGGSYAHYALFVSSDFPVGSAISVTYAGRTQSFTKQSSIVTPTAFDWTTIAELRQLLTDNFYLADLFQVTDPDVTDTASTFYLIARNKGYNPVTIEAPVSSTLFAITSSGDGTDPSDLQNYSLLARFEVDGFDPTPWLSFFPSAGVVSVPADILQGFFPEPDLPTIGSSFALQLLSSTLLRYRLRYCESYGDTPTAQLVSTSAYRYALPGELVQHYADQNLPDWADLNQPVPLTSSGLFCLRVIGEDAESTLDIHAHQPHYLYLFGYDTAEAVGTHHVLNAEVTAILHDGTTSPLLTTSFSLENGSLYRLPVGPDVILSLASDPDSVAYYTVSIFHENDTVAYTRTFHPIPSQFFQHTLLLQNKYGLLSAFAPATVAAATVVEGEKIRLLHHLAYNVTSRSQLFTATTPMLRRSEAAELSASLAGSYAYAKTNIGWLKIVIVPDTFTATDEAQDMLQLSFSFYFSLDQLSNLATATSSTENPVTYDEIILTEDGFAAAQEESSPILLESAQ